MPYSQCVSTTSYPLFASVAESIVTFGPIFHVGCRSASSAVTPSSSPSGRSRKGPPDAVSATRETSSIRSPTRHCQSAQCSLSTGRSRSPAPPASGRTRCPPVTSTSLFASATRFPASRAAIVGARPAMPGVATRTRSTSSRVTRSQSASSPSRSCSTAVLAPVSFASASSARALRAEASAVTRRRSGCAATTSSACLPMEPVAPRIAIRVTTSPSSHPLRQCKHERDGRGEKDQAVDAVEHAPVARQQGARILGPSGTFDRRFDEIAAETHRTDERRDEQCRSRLDPGRRRDEQRDDRRGREPRERPFPRLPRAHARRDPAPADARADQVRRHIGGPRRNEREEQPHRKIAQPSTRRIRSGHPQVDEVAERETQVERAAEGEERPRDAGDSAAACGLREEHQDRDHAEGADEREAHERKTRRPYGLRHVRDDECEREEHADEPRLVRPITEERAQLDVAEDREDGHEDHEGRWGREQGGEHDHPVDERGRGAALEVGHQRPKRRSRDAYEASAASRSRTEKSGHSTGVAHISAYATSQSRKLETRSSPPVRTSRSGSGCSGAYSRDAMAASSTASGVTPSRTIRLTASTISARPP